MVVALAGGSLFFKDILERVEQLLLTKVLPGLDRNASEPAGGITVDGGCCFGRQPALQRHRNDLAEWCRFLGQNDKLYVVCGIRCGKEYRWERGIDSNAVRNAIRGVGGLPINDLVGVHTAGEGINIGWLALYSSDRETSNIRRVGYTPHQNDECRVSIPPNDVGEYVGYTRLIGFGCRGREKFAGGG